MPIIYHITTKQAWQAAQHDGIYRAESLESQGFIHLSQRGQVLRVADAIYRGVTGLVLLCVDTERLRAPLKYEPPDTSVPAEHVQTEFFPHLYGALNVDAVMLAVDFPPSLDGCFTLPDTLP